MGNKEIDYKSEVLKMFPDAKCKRIGIDNGHSTIARYVVFKCDSVLMGDAISTPTHTNAGAWKSAYWTKTDTP